MDTLGTLAPDEVEFVKKAKAAGYSKQDAIASIQRKRAGKLQPSKQLSNSGTFDYFGDSEKQTSTPTGGIRGIASKLGGDRGDAERLNPVGKIVSNIDDKVQQIPTLSESERDTFAQEKLGGFGRGMGAVPTMLANAPGSLAKLATGIARGVTNPLDTAVGVGKLVGTEEGQQALKDRYVDNIGQTMTEDPIGLASDLLTVGGGVASAAGKGARMANMGNTASKLSSFGSTALGASDLGIPSGISKLKSKIPDIQNPVARGVAKVAVAPMNPTDTAVDLYNNVGEIKGNMTRGITRKLPEKVVENQLALTPRERAKVERTGVTPAQFVLEKGIAGLANEDKVHALQTIANDSYSKVTKAFEGVPASEAISDTAINHMLGTMIDEMKKSDIVAREHKNFIKALEDMSGRQSFSPQEVLAIRRDFDAIVGNKMYNAQGRVTNLEDEILSGYRSTANDLLQEVGDRYGIDMRSLNDNIRNSIAIRDGLLRTISQTNKNNYFGLQDLGLGAILGGGNPVLGAAFAKGIEAGSPSLMQWLYSMNKAAPENINLKRGAGFISKNNNDSRFSLSDYTNRGTVLPEGQELKLEPSKSPLGRPITINEGASGGDIQSAGQNIGSRGYDGVSQGTAGGNASPIEGGGTNVQKNISDGMSSNSNVNLLDTTTPLRKGLLGKPKPPKDKRTEGLLGKKRPALQSSTTLSPTTPIDATQGARPIINTAGNAGGNPITSRAGEVSGVRPEIPGNTLGKNALIRANAGGINSNGVGAFSDKEVSRFLAESERLNKQSQMYDDISKAFDDPAMEDYLGHVEVMKGFKDPITYDEFVKGKDAFFDKINKSVIQKDASYKLYKSYLDKVRVIESREQRIGKVGNKKIGLLGKSKQKKQFVIDKEKLIESIAEDFGVDAKEASNIYDDMVEKYRND